MATSSTSLAPDNSTAAAFRAWGSAVNAALAALGLVQTGDTGQINWTSVAAPGASNTSQGYEIWKFNDALQATAPFFFKLEYGSGATAAAPGMWLTVSTATNGAGSLTGVVSTRMQPRGNTNSATSYNCYFSGSSNRFSCYLFRGAGSSNVEFGFYLERLKDANGADTSEGCYAVIGSFPSGWVAQVIPSSGAVLATDAPVCAGPSSASTGVIGTDVGTFSCFPMRGKLYPPCMNLVGYMNADLTVLNPVTLSLYGADHTMLPLGNPTTFLRGNSNGAPMMRYE
jgi:hypothetical protein